MCFVDEGRNFEEIQKIKAQIQKLEFFFDFKKKVFHPILNMETVQGGRAHSRRKRSSSKKSRKSHRHRRHSTRNKKRHMKRHMKHHTKRYRHGK